MHSEEMSNMGELLSAAKKNLREREKQIEQLRRQRDESIGNEMAALLKAAELMEKVDRYEDAMERMARNTGNPAVERIRKEAVEGPDDD